MLSHSKTYQIIDPGLLNHELSSIQSILERKETEDNWLQIDEAYLRLTALVSGSFENPALLPALKKLKRQIIDSLLTERTRLSRTVMGLCEELARVYGPDFDSLASFIIPALLKLCLRANKVFVSCATACLKTVLGYCKLPNLVEYFVDPLKNPSKTLKISAMECIERCLSVCEPDSLVEYLELVEQAIEIGAVDSTIEVRELTRTVFSRFSYLFPNQLNGFTMRMSETCRKHLKVQPVFKPATAPKRAPMKLKSEPMAVPSSDLTKKTIKRLSKAEVEEQKPLKTLQPVKVLVQEPTPRKRSTSAKPLSQPSSAIKNVKRSPTKESDLVKVANALKSSLWSCKVDAFTQLSTLLQNCNNWKAIHVKISEFYSIGLGDSHFKVVQAALGSLNSCIVDLEQDTLNSVVPRVLGIAYNQQLMSKPGMNELVSSVLVKIRNLQVEAVCNSLSSGLYNQEFSRNLKVKIGLVGFIAELDSVYFEQFSKSKTFLSRFCGVCGDLDASNAQLVHEIISKLFKSSGKEAFMTAFATVKPADKSFLFKLLGTDSLDGYFESSTSPVKVGRSRSVSSSPRKTSPLNSVRNSLKTSEPLDLSIVATPIRISSSMVKDATSIKATPTREVFALATPTKDSTPLKASPTKDITPLKASPTKETVIATPTRQSPVKSTVKHSKLPSPTKFKAESPVKLLIQAKKLQTRISSSVIPTSDSLETLVDSNPFEDYPLEKSIQEIVQGILSGSTSSVIECLDLLQQLLSQDPKLVELHANNVLLALLHAEATENQNSLDSLDISMHLSHTLDSFESIISKNVLLDAVNFCVTKGNTSRICFELLNRMVLYEKDQFQLRSGLNSTGFTLNAPGIDWTAIITSAVELMDSSRTSDRRTAVDFLYHYSTLPYTNGMHQIVSRNCGKSKDLIVKNMIENRFL